MNSIRSTTYLPARPRTTFWIAAGFVAGALSVLIFHQGTIAVLNVLDLTQRAPYSMAPMEPFGVPQFLSLTFWGGVWGALCAAAFSHLDGTRLVAASLVFGAVLPTLVAWFVVAPFKEQPMAAGYVPMAMAFGVIVNAAWGLGTGLGLALFRRERRRGDRRRAVERRHAGTDRRRAVAVMA
jgi:hypothetical protein